MPTDPDAPAPRDAMDERNYYAVIRGTLYQVQARNLEEAAATMQWYASDNRPIDPGDLLRRARDVERDAPDPRIATLEADLAAARADNHELLDAAWHANHDLATLTGDIAHHELCRAEIESLCASMEQDIAGLHLTIAVQDAHAARQDAAITEAMGEWLASEAIAKRKSRALAEITRRVEGAIAHAMTDDPGAVMSMKLLLGDIKAAVADEAYGFFFERNAPTPPTDAALRRLIRDELYEALALLASNDIGWFETMETLAERVERERAGAGEGGDE